MKRPTKAEEALQKQIRILDRREEELDLQISHLSTERKSHRDIRMQLEQEIRNIRSLRATTKPKATP